jgi:hypothetical protein
MSDNAYYMPFFRWKTSHNPPVFVFNQVLVPDRDFSFAAGDVQHVAREGDAGDAALELAHQFYALFKRDAEVAGAVRAVELVQVVGDYADVGEAFEEVFQDFGGVVYAF